MSRQENIIALLKKANSQFKNIEIGYEKSLHEKKISAELKIDIKNFFENLRSVLDYLAHEIRENKNITGLDKYYFPILSTLSEFETVIEKSYQGLKENNLELFNFLLSIQPFQSPSNVWLKNFNKLNNSNKHDNLVEQTREEQEQIHVTDKNGSGVVSWMPGAVRFGPGVSIMGVPVNPNTQMLVPSSSTSVKKIIWIDFQFEEIKTSAIFLMKESLKGIEEISKQIFNKL